MKKQLAMILSAVILGSVLSGCASPESSKSPNEEISSSYTSSMSSSDLPISSENEESASTSGEASEKTESEKIANELSFLVDFSKTTDDSDLLQAADYASSYISKLESGSITEDEAKALKTNVNTLVYMNIEDSIKSYANTIASLGYTNNTDITASLKSLSQKTIEECYSSGKTVLDYLEKIYPDGSKVSAKNYYTSLGTIFYDTEDKESGYYTAFVETDDNAMVIYTELPSAWSAKQKVSDILTMLDARDILENDIIIFRWFKDNGDVVASMALERFEDDWTFLYPLVWFDDESENFYNSLLN